MSKMNPTNLSGSEKSANVSLAKSETEDSIGSFNNDQMAPSTLKSVTQLLLIVLLFVTSLTGNSTICILMKRFKSIRTVPNTMFLANLAIVDLLNTFANLPFFIIVGVFELHQTLHGQLVSLLVALAQNFFNILKITSMLATMFDRLIAIIWGIQYYVWKTKTKAAKAICAVWLVSIAMVLPWVILASQIDLGDVPTYNYRIVYFDEFGKKTAFFSFLLFGLAITVLSLLTCCSYARKTRRYAKLRKDHHIAQAVGLDKARTRTEVQAACTIGLTVAAYFLCYVPCIVYAGLTSDSEEMTKTSEAKWFGFVANYFLFVSSACNPFIYLVRTTRFRVAIKQLLKNPCGSQDIEVENITRGNVGPACRLKRLPLAVVSPAPLPAAHTVIPG